MSLPFSVRVGLLKLRKLVKTDEDRSDDDELREAVYWIDQQLELDAKMQTKEARAREWSAAGLCSRCGDTDPQCICYAR